MPFKYDFLTQSQLLDLGLETMYIERNTPIDIISQTLNLSRRTLFYWKKKYEWDKKCFEKKHNQEILNQELLEFTKKIMQKISDDIDNNKHTPQSEIYSLMNILKNLPLVKSYELLNKGVKFTKAKLRLSPEIIKQIQKEIS